MTKRNLGLRVLCAGVFMMWAVAATAQTKPAVWTTSKDVQKIANKKMFENEALANNHVQPESVSPTWMIAKGVHRSTDQPVKQNNMRSAGYPEWTISKGVQRISRK